MGRFLLQMPVGPLSLIDPLLELKGLRFLRGLAIQTSKTRTRKAAKHLRQDGSEEPRRLR